MTADPNWPFVVIAYGVTIAAIGAVTVSIILEHRRLRAELARLGASTSEDGGPR
jgi:heme exporter protein CcmD